MLMLVAFFGHLALPTGGFLVLCALLFPTAVALERQHPLFRPQPRYYASLRQAESARDMKAILCPEAANAAA